MRIWKWFVKALAKAVAAEVETLALLEVAKLSIQEGESLFVIVKGRPSLGELDRLHKNLCEMTGLDGKRVLILISDVTVFTVGKNFPQE